MEKILIYSLIVIAILYLIIEKSKSVIKADLNEWCKIIIWAISNFMIYCLLQYSYGFIRWTIRFNKFHEYGIAGTVLLFIVIHILAILLVMFFSPFKNMG